MSFKGSFQKYTQSLLNLIDYQQYLITVPYVTPRKSVTMVVCGITVGQQYTQLKIINLLTKSKKKMNIEEKQEVSGTKNHLLFLMSQFESKEQLQKHLEDSLVMEVTKRGYLRERR